MSLADTKSSEEKCAKCFAALHSNTVPVRCNVSTKEFHQKCSTGLKASTSDNQWKCEKCTKLQQNRIAASTNCQLPGPTNWSPSQLLPVTFQNKLKTYHWKADGIRPKFVELCNWLINSDIDSLAVQESKLWKTDKTPFIKGYATTWNDQNNITGSDLLLFIRTDIVFEQLHSLKNARMEILSIRLKTTKSTSLELYSVYLPNTCTQLYSSNPSLIKPGPSSLFLVDLNGHSQMWDSFQPQKQRGNEILDWILDNGLHIINDGSATRTSRSTGNDSTHGISLCGSNWSAKISWRLAESIGSSDHLPILTKINHKICYQLLSQELLDGIETTLTGPALQTKSKSRKWTIFLMNITYLFKSLVSLTFSSQLKQLTVEDLNPARNVNLGWFHTCKQKSALEIASLGQYIKIDRRGSMLAVKPRRLSTRPRQKVGKTFFKTECRIQMAQMCGKPFKV